jgi:HD-GYP domain-containing protein (c-di-GMP phosphodiesterase class II)
MILQHHERLDGSGYPNGLVGDEIILEARIIAVADVLEAITSHRPYRPARGLDKAIEVLSEGRGKVFDAQVIDACMSLIKSNQLELSH